MRKLKRILIPPLVACTTLSTWAQTMRSCLFMLVTLVSIMLKAQVEPCGPVPTENQLRWQEMEMYAFIHYSLNTYTDQEWGFGNEDPKLFNLPAWIASSGHACANRQA